MADIERHLNHRPVEAGPPSAAYQLRTFVRRNRALVGAVASVAVVLLLAVIGMSLLTNWALRERTRAEAGHVAEERERKKAEAINEFVTQALVSSDPHQGGTQGFLVTAAMEKAIELLDAGEPNDQPETEAALRLTISKILDGNARSEDALRLAERALEINQELHPGDHPEVARSLNNVATCLVSLGRPAEALPRFEAALAMCRRVLPPDHSHTLDPQMGLAETLVTLGRYADAEVLLRDAAGQCERSEESRHLRWGNVLEQSLLLYNAWHVAEPNMGYDAKATEWGAKLEAWPASSQSETTQIAP